jgi:XTP/dITP diphosphohydrolase
MTIVLATHNKHKRDELLALLNANSDLQVEIKTLDDIEPLIGEIEETGTTLEENARIKARTVHQLTGLPALADDTGLEVTALNGAPGVYSARYAGVGCTYLDNVNKLLSALGSRNDRDARFRTALCFVDATGREHFFDGTVEGFITREPRGSEGFGYDPVFEPLEDLERRTFAEMPATEKNRISHRGRAMRAFAAWLKGRSF